MKRSRLFSILCSFFLVLLTVVGCKETPTPEPTPTPNPNPEPEPATGIVVEVTGKTFNSIEIGVTVNDYEGMYYVASYPYLDYEVDLENSPQVMAETFMDLELTQWFGDLSAPDGSYVFQGDASIQVGYSWLMSPNTEYIIAVFGMNAQGEVLTDVVTVVDFTEPYANNPIVMEEVSSTVEDIEIRTTSTPADQNYMVFAYTTAAFMDEYLGSEDYITDEIMAAFVEAGKDLSVVDNALIFSGNKTINLGESWNIIGNTEYTIFAVLLDQFGIRASEVEMLEVKTPDYPAAEGTLTSITISGITHDDAIATIDAGDFSGAYYTAHYSVEDFQTKLNSDLSALADALIDYELNDYFRDLSHVDGEVIHSGSSTYQLSKSIWNTEPTTEYFVIAFGINPDGSRSSDIIVSENFTTIQAPANQFAIEINDLSEYEARVAITPTTLDETYFMEVVEKSFYESMTADEFVSHFENKYGGFFTYFLKEGVTSTLIRNLKPGTEYVVAVCTYYRSGGRGGEFTAYPFTTNGEQLPDLTVPETIIIPDVDYGTLEPFNIASDSFEFSWTPADPNTRVMMNKMSAADFDLYTSDEEVIKSHLTSYYDQSVDKEWTFRYFIYFNTVIGGGEGWMPSVSPESEWVVYCYGIDLVTGQPTTKLEVLRVTTLAEGEPTVLPAPRSDAALGKASQEESVVTSEPAAKKLSFEAIDKYIEQREVTVIGQKSIKEKAIKSLR